MPPRKKAAMTEAHKASSAKGASRRGAVHDYLEWLEWSKPTRGHKRDTSPERLAEVEAQIAYSSCARRSWQRLSHTDDGECEPAGQPAGGVFGTHRQAIRRHPTCSGLINEYHQAA
jgi:hypothetical protein